MNITHQQVAEITLILSYFTLGIIVVYVLDKTGWFGGPTIDKTSTGGTTLRFMIILFWPAMVVIAGIWYIMDFIRWHTRNFKK